MIFSNNKDFPFPTFFFLNQNQVKTSSQEKTKQNWKAVVKERLSSSRGCIEVEKAFSNFVLDMVAGLGVDWMFLSLR